MAPDGRSKDALRWRPSQVGWIATINKKLLVAKKGVVVLVVVVVVSRLVEELHRIPRVVRWLAVCDRSWRRLKALKQVHQSTMCAFFLECSQIVDYPLTNI